MEHEQKRGLDREEKRSESGKGSEGRRERERRGYVGRLRESGCSGRTMARSGEI